MSAHQTSLSPAKRWLILPDAPASLAGAVKVWSQPVAMLTYMPEAPTANPMFLEKRVYQGSSGRVYPLPFIDRIATDPIEREWEAIHIENEFLRLMILPEIGGRIHVGFDKLSGYDFFYRQNVIKPALVGLAGPWLSGGVEFNWPQHHRPATFMPVNTKIEHGPDGEVTVWCSDHDPMLRMKGMHGICLRPGQAVVDLKVRLYNRTPDTQTFLWWANVATRVHEGFQSFFPTDVRYVADHARRAITSFPLSDRSYYGVDYAGRASDGVPADERPSHFRPDGSYAANDLSWYANIPVPTSYMVTGTSQDFFGGYDHTAHAGVVHVADHHIAPGKKQWTWGNHSFGYAWDRSLTDDDGPYIELMAGVYTDNQPDFSYLAPWETKTFVQSWYPLRDTGVPQMATRDAALHLSLEENVLHLRVGVTRDICDADVHLLVDGLIRESWSVNLKTRETFVRRVAVPAGLMVESVCVRILAQGNLLLEYDPSNVVPAAAPEAAVEPLPPQQMESIDELYLTGVHLDQYRHATRQPELYWREALRRDPQESRCLNAMGMWHHRRGELAEAASCFRAAIHRLTRLNPNPIGGEAYYNLGLSLRLLDDATGAYDAFYKATWNAAWRSPAYFALAEIDAGRRRWRNAEDHLRRALRAEADHLHARNLLTFVLRTQGRFAEADALLQESLTLDPLDIGALWLMGEAPRAGQLVLDLAYDLTRSGRTEEAIRLLEGADLRADDGSAAILLLTLLDLQSRAHPLSPSTIARTLQQLEATTPALCFPSRLDELLVLERTVKRDPSRALAWVLLGNLLYDRRQHEDAIHAWESASRADSGLPLVWRNLGIGYFNVRRDEAAAVSAYERAFELDQSDSRVFYERDQLWKRIGRQPRERLAELLRHPEHVQSRDSLTVELAMLQNQLGEPAKSLSLLESRHFQPWEGGEGLVLGEYARAMLLLGKEALSTGKPEAALRSFKAALEPPESLGEAQHLLANQSDIFYWTGRANESLGRALEATRWFERAIRQRGDFRQMSVRTVSEMTFWSGLAMKRLGRDGEARELFSTIAEHASRLHQKPPVIDYFATSLPTMLLFEDDLEKRTTIEADLLTGQALIGLGETEKAHLLLKSILRRDLNHAAAHDLLLCIQMGEAVTVHS